MRQKKHKPRYLLMHCISLLLLSLAAIVCTGMVVAQEKIQGKVQEKILSNGLKILVLEDHRAPVVVSQIWYKVGSSYEYDGITGVSHSLEHMMFKGTTKYPDDAFTSIVSANGAQDNAFTTQDYTAYYQIFARDKLPIMLDLESDRMRNLVLKQKDFAKEIMVVREERRWRTEDKPQALLYEQLQVTAFDNSGYHHPVIGWMEDLQHLTLADQKTWYQRYYSPNNAILVIVGDVQSKQAIALAEQYFGAIKPSKLPPQKPRIERPQRSTKQVMLRVPAKLSTVMLGYKTPVINTARSNGDIADWEPYALSLLSAVLDGGDSTRLPRKLVKEQEIAASASTSYSLNDRMQTLFTLSAIPVEGVSTTQIKNALLHEIALIQKEGVTKAELQRVKNQMIASEEYEKDSIYFQAYKLGQAEASGIGWQTALAYNRNIRRITAGQVQKVAQKYLRPERLTIAILDAQAQTEDTMTANKPTTTQNIADKKGS